MADGSIPSPSVQFNPNAGGREGVNQEPPILRTLSEHNDSVYRNQVAGFKNSGVLCDKCQLEGKTTEMKLFPWENGYDTIHWYRLHPSSAQVICPVCLVKADIKDPPQPTVVRTEVQQFQGTKRVDTYWSNGELESKWIDDPKPSVKIQMPIQPKKKVEIGIKIGKYFWHLLAFVVVEFGWIIVSELMK